MIEIRKAVKTDAEQAWQIRNQAILDQCAGFYPDEDLQLWTAGHVSEHFSKLVAEHFQVAVVNTVVVGTGMVDCQTGQIDAVFVRPDYMRRGIGQEIMRRLEKFAVDAGLKKLSLDSTLNAADFYRRCGFTSGPVGVYNSPRGISLACVPMTKTLGQNVE